jgi:CheY-like chemotaxis protein
MSYNNTENSLYIFDNLQVLIAEDNQMNQLVVSKLMSKWGVQIDIAEDGQEAIQKTKDKAYDIILMDLQMPNVDGYDATIAIRNDAKNLCQNTPIIALTASVTGDVKDKCLEVGMNDYVSKPIESLLLNQKIAGYHPDKIHKNDTNQVNKNYTNLKYLLENADGDMAFVSQMINIFNKQVPEALKDLYREESNKDLTALKAVSHKMRPSFSAFGIDDGKNILEEIESICSKKDKIDTLVTLIKKLENICDIASIELTKKLTEIEKL